MIRKKLDNKYYSNKSIVLQTIDWNSYDVFDENNNDSDNDNSDDSQEDNKKIIKRKYIIKAYGVTEEGHSISLNIIDFTPYFFLKIPQNWNNSDFRAFINQIKSLAEKQNKYHSESLISSEIVERKEFYEFSNNKLLKYCRFVFKNINGFYAYQKLIKYNKFKINNKKYDLSKNTDDEKYGLYESSINPLIRFFHVKKINPVGWIKLNYGKYNVNVLKKTRCQIDLTVHYNDIEVIEKNSIGKILIASFDIECTSEDGSFPKASRKGDKIIQIGTTVYEYGNNNCILKHITTLKKSDPIEGAIVESFDNERDVVIGWSKFIKELDPDILTGYNIWDFDENYINERAKNGNCGECRDYSEIVLRNLSRNKEKLPEFKIKELSSSALGNNILKFFDIEGLVQIDLYKLMQKDYKLDSYKLDNVCKHFMKEQKDDLSPKKLFEYFQKGYPELIKIIAAYCIQDNILCNRLINKLNIISNNVGMANVCCVPLSYLFLRGQGIKIFSLVSDTCRDENFLIKDYLEIDNKSYEGAIVFDPEPGIYFEPVAVNDYASLYPSSMIAENISHDSFVGYREYSIDKNGEETVIKDTLCNKENLLNLDDYNYNYIKYDVFEGIGDEKKKVGYKECCFAEKKTGEKSVLPRILMRLLKARKDTRKKMLYETVTINDQNKYIGVVEISNNKIIIKNVEGEKWIFDEDDVVEKHDTYDEFEKAVLDGLQLAYKVVCNSVYGQVGATTSNICFKELAACTTATGRNMVTVAKDLTLEKYEGSKLVYGDSVTGDEPLILRNNDGKIIIKTIESLSNNWEQYENFKPFDSIESNRREKEKAFVNYEVWANGKWNPIKKVIRHKTNKNIYRVNTHGGVVDVTEDHSLLNEKLEKIKPNCCIIGETRLAQSFPIFNNDNEPLHLNEIVNIIYKYEKYERSLDEKRAFIYGIFYGDGSCGKYITKYGNKYSWALNNQDNLLLNQCIIYLSELYGDNTSFKILNTMKSSGVNKLVPKGKIKFMVDLYRTKFYDNKKLKKIPDEIINAPHNIRLNFFIGYYAADGGKQLNSNCKNISFSNKGKIGSCGLYYIVKSLGYSASIRIRNDKLSIYNISCCLNSYYNNGQRKEKDIVKKIILIRNSSDEYVYDLETEHGNFNAGVGELTLANTDSIFISFVDYIKKHYGNNLSEKDMLKYTIQLGEESGEYVTSKLKKPQHLEYEKTFYPFIIFSKKRYVGNKYELNIEKFKQTSMGIVLKRRDNAPIVKDVYGGIIDIILNERDILKSKNFFKNETKNLFGGNIDINKLVISKSIRADYANPNQIAHKVLADRIGERDPGNKPSSNDRIPYCYINTKSLKCIICDCKINPENCKCIVCMKIFCAFHLKSHKKSCKKICRFCKIDEKNCVLEYCTTCTGWYCSNGGCFKKHTIRNDKYGNVHYDKCKKKLTNKLLQGDILEHPNYIIENDLLIDYRYYFDHQIKKPVYQIFELDMKNPEKLVEDIIRDDNNKNNNVTAITNWFNIVDKDTNNIDNKNNLKIKDQKLNDFCLNCDSDEEFFIANDLNENIKEL